MPMLAKPAAIWPMKEGVPIIIRVVFYNGISAAAVGQQPISRLNSTICVCIFYQYLAFPIEVGLSYFHPL